jgi:hypothetical protein
MGFNPPEHVGMQVAKVQWQPGVRPPDSQIRPPR